MSRVSTLSCVALAALSASCGEDGDGARAAPPPVVLISLDTVRADSLSIYGGPAGATPVLDAFAERATRYASCVSSAPWTLPSHASMFTGLYPSEHGAHTFLPGEGHRGDNVFALAPGFDTLAEALARLGYRTGGVVANAIYMRPMLGLGAGFESWDVRRDPGTRITDRALAWLDGLPGGDRPPFLFVNYMDAHRPYAAGDAGVDAAAELDALIDAVMARGEAPGAQGERVRALHRNAVTRLDAEVGRLFDGLRERGLFERALVVVTSDHGEAFGGHGIVEHSKDVWEDLVRVPLIVKAPGQRDGAVREVRASSVDVPGIVAEALAAAGYPGLGSTFPRRPGGHPVRTENHYSRLPDLARYGDRFRRRRHAIYDGRWKLVVGSDGSTELYDVEADPEELLDLAASRADVTERLISGLERALAEAPYEGDRVLPGQLSAAQTRDMRVLGYGGVGTAEGER
ncbi:MAG: sulfatase-like hydrolase/transferase [Planctomycetota bacterium]